MGTELEFLISSQVVLSRAALNQWLTPVRSLFFSYIMEVHKQVVRAWYHDVRTQAPSACFLLYVACGFLFQSGCLSSTHHVHIPASKNEEVGEGCPLPF